VLWVVPWPSLWAGSIATLVALVEVGLWIVGLSNFDFDGGIQGEQQHTWFSDLGVSYHVGLYGFSLWLVGLTIVCTAAAIAYAWWAGRDRSRAYFGLMLFLLGAGRRRLHVAGPRPLLRVLRGDADPALRADRRVGRRRTARARRTRSSSTRWPARC
jgi:hypothetical protein